MTITIHLLLVVALVALALVIGWWAAAVAIVLGFALGWIAAQFDGFDDIGNKE